MPTLNWIGKEAVVKHHKEAPFTSGLTAADHRTFGSGSGFFSESGNRAATVMRYFPPLCCKRMLGGLLAELSGGHCRFVMMKDQQWQEIEAIFLEGAA
jgi:hypothetical protein